MSARELTAAQIEGIRKHCLNGVCKMTPEERKARQRKYRDDVLANPFRRQQYAEYFRKRRKSRVCANARTHRRERGTTQMLRRRGNNAGRSTVG